MRIYKILIYTAVLCLACDGGTKVVQPHESNNNSDQSTGIFNGRENTNRQAVNNDNGSSLNGDMHLVKVMEVLPTEKYVYLRVNENEDEYWIATGKQDVAVGEQYFYKNGLLKTNFESKEYNRIFDKVYLVSQIIPQNHSHSENTGGASSNTQSNVDNQPVEGSISIKEIVENAQKYKGKEIQVTGNVSKLNANIMGRNWIHLKDGTKDEYDLVLTSDQPIPEGHRVTMTGIVNLDVDFGSGYRYDILIENAKALRE